MNFSAADIFRVLNSRQKANAFYDSLPALFPTPEGLGAVRAELNRRDLFYLLTRTLHRPDANNEWCFARCREVQADAYGFLDLWSREHYKSTIITFAHSIQEHLNDPETTTGIFSHTRGIAKAFLRQIMREYETNDELKTLHLDVLYADPRRQAPKWSEDDGIVCRRSGNPKEATFEAWGLTDGQPTGRHFKRLKYDDVVTLESVNTPDQIQKSITAWETSLNLGAAGGTAQYIGTRYHFSDAYKTIQDRGIRPRVRLATQEPRLWDDAILAEKREKMGPFTFSCQILQNPLADSVMGFKEEWLRYYDPQMLAQYHGEEWWRSMNLYLLCDPANAKKKYSDYTVFMLIGLATDGNKYLVSGLRSRLNLAERTRWLFWFHRRFRPLLVGYEQYGLQADIEHMREKMGQELYHFDILPLGGTMNKTDRIRRMVPDFDAGKIYLPGRLPFPDHEGKIQDLTALFKDEYLSFPVVTHDDSLDCFARIYDEALGAHVPMPHPDGLPGRPVADGGGSILKTNSDWEPESFR